MEYFNAFITGGIICALSQILIDKTKLTPARILVSYVVLGVILQSFGLYQRLVDFGGAGERRREGRRRKGAARRVHGRGERRGGRHCGSNRIRLPVRAAVAPSR